MAIQATPFVLQGASTGANIFRQAVSSAFVNGGILAANELQVLQATPTANMTVVVSPGRAKIVGTSATAPTGAPTGSYTWTTQGMYDVLNDASATLTISAADTSNPRIDLVYIQVQDAFYTGSNSQATLAVATGTPATSPAVPTTPVNAIALAQIAVARNATSVTTSNITNLATQATLMGQVIVYQTKAALLAATGMVPNALAAVVADSTVTNNAFYYYTGSAWANVTSTAGFMPTGGTAGQTIVKSSGTDYAAAWGTLPISGGGTGVTALTGSQFVTTNSGGTALTTQASVSLSSNVSGTLPVANGGTGVTSMTAGLLRYSGSALLSGQTVAASDIPAAEQANINAGGLYSGGVVGGGVFNVFVQSTQPSSGVTSGDLWFW